MALFGLLKKDSGPSEMKVKSYCFVKKDEELFDLLTSNPIFELSTEELIKKGYAGKTIYKFYSDYRGNDVSLEPDPKNPADKNAVKILLFGKFFGYVNREDAPFIKQLIKKNAIIDLKLQNKGGPIRKIYKNGHSSANKYEFETTLYITHK